MRMRVICAVTLAVIAVLVACSGEGGRNDSWLDRALEKHETLQLAHERGRETVVPEHSPLVVVTKGAIWLDEREVLLLLGGEVAKNHRRGSIIVPLFDALKVEADRRKEKAGNGGSPFKGAVVVAFDESASDDLRRAVLYTLGQAQFAAFSIAVERSDGAMAVVQSNLPPIGG